MKQVVDNTVISNIRTSQTYSVPKANEKRKFPQISLIPLKT